jgi:CRP-like cAMP-binding protein
MEDIRKKLQKISLFQGFRDSAESIEKIAALVKLKKFPSGSYIIKEGDKGDEMYILSEGNVHIEKTTMHNDTFTVVKLSSDMNVFFGEMALIDDDVRSASVLADSECTCYALTKNKFQKLASEDYRIGYFVTMEISKILSGRLRKSSQDTITLFEALVTEIGDLD